MQVSLGALSTPYSVRRLRRMNGSAASLKPIDAFVIHIPLCDIRGNGRG